MWKWLKEILFGKKSNENPVLVQEMEQEEEDILEETVNRKELSFLEEMKIILGEYGQLFKSRYDEDYDSILTDYVDDEGLKELCIIGFHEERDQVLLIFKDVMQEGTFDIERIEDISAAFKKGMDYVKFEYHGIRHALDVIVTFSRDFTVDDNRQRKLVMGTFYKIAEDIRQVMPDIRQQYSQSQNA